ncbi:M16 family metallopeptidase [Algoriphagus winogradskyi]|uniref:Predicted Zn-dependent peptidase n=1 Tax=Algoriphagus winogradskyi TaxID=237017 RepID=A0ABY1PBP2_9BACT|nr:pitrilysin family protein [Algoriphagus winogradskyi]SMP30272.1 Predicted Zn-dependent peptidase [Algoriphagus winogradskyi]
MKKITISFVLSLLVSIVSFAQVDRSQFPKAGPAPVIKIGEAETFTLENGLKVFVVENDKLPRVSFTLVFERDPIMEGDKAGMTGFVGEMLTAGTANRTKDELDEEIDFIGASLGASSTSVSASSLKKHQDKVLDLMTDVLFNPVFPQEELDKLKKQSITALATSKDEPGAISSRLSNAMVYGKDHPYGEVQTEESLTNVTVEDIKTYYETFFKPNVAYLAIVGDMSKAEAEKVVKSYFSDWEQGDVPSFTYPKPAPADKNMVALVDRSSSVQTVIDIAQPIELKVGDEDYIPSRVLNQIFGGGSSSRLFMNLREDKGYTYGAYSSFAPDKLVGQFSANASVRTEVTDSAVYEFIYEINRLVKDGVTQEELDKAKANLAGSFGRSLESPSTIASFALNIERYDLPKDYYETYLQKMNALTVADINKTADDLIDPSKLYITAVGNGTEIKDKLAQFGEVMMFDNMGFPAKEMAAVDADMTSEKVIENYIAAIGGKAKASAIKAAKLEMVAEVMGTQLTIELIHDDANMRFAQKTLVGGNVMQTSVVKDGKGTASVQGQSMAMTDEQVDAAKLGTYFIPELYFGTMGYTLTLDGIKDVEGTPAYKVIVATPLGSSVTNYYSVESGLKIKNENPVSGDTFYSDYQEKNGVLIPMTQTIKSAMIPVPLEAKITNLEINPELTEADFN